MLLSDKIEACTILATETCIRHRYEYYPYTTLNHKSILVLDDDFDIATLIRQSLQKHGFDVYAFTDPLLALVDFQNNFESYSLVLCDINMPAMTGFEFGKKVREIDPSVKILLMSAADTNNAKYRKHALAVNSNGFIQKPFFLNEMICIVENHLTK